MRSSALWKHILEATELFSTGFAVHALKGLYAIILSYLAL
jgi:hypothetical protein